MQGGESWVRAFDSRWNAGYEQGILEHMADDVVIRLSPPPMREVYNGKEEAREFVQALLPGFYVDSDNIQGSGESIRWNFKVGFDAMRQVGVNELTGEAQATIQQGKAKAFNPTFDEATVQRIQQAMGGQQT